MKARWSLACPLALLGLCSSVALAKNEIYTGPCTKNVSSAIARAGGADSLFPDFFTHWWKKNAKNYPGVCLSSRPNSAARNYLLVFSESEHYYSGLMPTTHTDTSTSFTTLSANGSAIDQYGDFWTFTATGNAQTTTTTTVHEIVPYTDRSVGLFVKTYDSTGRIIRSDGHMYRSRTGGDADSTAGYNIGSALSNINARGKMLKSSLLAISEDQDAPLPEGRAEAASVKAVSVTQPPTTAMIERTTAPATEVEDKGRDAEATPGGSPPTHEAIAEISSEPSGADIEIDGNFVGSTPSSLGVAAGEHEVLISKKGYKQWRRTLKVSTGKITAVAVLEPIPVSSSEAANAPSAVRPEINSSAAIQPSPLSHGTVSDGHSKTDPTNLTASLPEVRIGVSFAGNPEVRHDGVEIFGVVPAGPAAGIDMRAGDVILAIDDHYLFTIEEVRAELLRHLSETRLKMRYRRNQLISENYITLGKVTDPGK